VLRQRQAMHYERFRFSFHLNLYFVVLLSPYFSIRPLSAAPFKSLLAVACDISLNDLK
jgi:hypothetical protein